MKKTLVFTLVAAPLCMLVRLFSHIYIIDQNGYFTYTGILGAVLRYSLWVLLGLGVITALCIMFSKNKQMADKKYAAYGKGFAVLSLILSAFLLLEAGLRLGYSVAAKSIDILGIASLLLALYFAVLGIEILNEKESAGLTLVFGFFAPLAVLCRAIVLFFNSFKTVNKSGTKLELLTICALALFITALVLSKVGATITVKRFKAVCMLFCLVSFAYAIPSAYAIIKSGFIMQNAYGLLFISQVIILQLLSFTALVRLTYYKPKEPIPEPEVFQPELDIFIDEIPEQQSEDAE